MSKELPTKTGKKWTKEPYSQYALIHRHLLEHGGMTKGAGGREGNEENNFRTSGVNAANLATRATVKVLLLTRGKCAHGDPRMWR